MSSNTNLDFVKFVKNKKHAKPDDDDLYEIDFLGRKKEGISFNDTIPNDVKKLVIKEGELSLSDLLSKNKNKILEEPKKKENGEKNKKEENKDEKQSEDEEEISRGNDSYNESEDFEENINHFIGHKRENVDEMEEIIKEIKERSEGLKRRNKNEYEEESEEKEEKKKKKKKREKKENKENKKSKKEKVKNIIDKKENE